MRHSTLIYALFIAGIALVGCSNPVKKARHADTLAREWNKTIPGNFSKPSKMVFDSTHIDTFIKQFPDVGAQGAQMKNFYRGRNYSYAWFDGGILIEHAGNLANRVMNLQNDGIYKTSPYQKVLDSLLHAGGKNPPDLKLELMLTAQYFIFSKLAWQGMDDSVSKAVGWNLPRKKIAYQQYLDSLLKEPKKQLPANEPVYRQYELLREFLRKYRALDAIDPWRPIAIGHTKFKLGDTSAVLAQIKSRLFKLEDFKGDTASRIFDEDLQNGIKRFQQRHGLTINGVPDKSTMAEMNVPIKSRIKQLLVNMERSRWLPVSLGSEYIAVNIPEFKLHVYRADSLLWSCNVVVGQTVHQTSVFYGEIKYVVFSPYWNVPESIVRKEVLPGIRRHPNYISKNRMEITGYQNGLPVVRQKPGPENSLGLVKFLFPNSYNIYLHDTPSKSLFNESTRAFSHGCIRVVEPFKLATFLLKNNQEWDPNKIEKAMQAGTERSVTLTKKVPVFIAYFTAFTDRSNRLNFRKDIYSLDDRLAAMILSANGDY